MGRIFDADGNPISIGGHHELVSGASDGLQRQVSPFLHRLLGGVNPRFLYHGSTHPETKFAYLLQQFRPGQRFHVNVVINHSGGSCPFDGEPRGCVSNVAALIPRGSSMTIWHSGPNGPLGLRIWGRR